MTDYGGCIYVSDKRDWEEALLPALDERGYFTDTVSVLNWKLKKKEIFLISLDGHSISYAALVHSGNKVTTGKRRIRVTNVIDFVSTLSLKIIHNALPPRLQMYFPRSIASSGQRLPPKTWKAVNSEIKRLRPQVAAELEHLEQLRQYNSTQLDNPSQSVIAQEKDATGLALRFANIQPTELYEWRFNIDEPAPFIKGLSKARITEDQMVAHDMEVFGDWSRIERYQVGAAVFERESLVSDRLTIVNVNRHPIERTLGVDLVYYHHSYRAYLMVQYKRMQKEGSKWIYRFNDRSYPIELERMKAFRHKTKVSNHNLIRLLTDYRINSELFFFKLCPATAMDPTSTQMIKGMYLPFDFWESLVNSLDILGPRGGRQITYENTARYLNNTLFIQLVQDGWIGSQETDRNLITEIIEKSIEEDRSVILAANVAS